MGNKCTGVAATDQDGGAAAMEGQAESATQDFSVHAIFSKLGDPVTSISDAIIELRAQIRQADDDALHERQRHGALDPPATSEATNDVLLLNVGGHLMSVSRRHMTQGDGVEGTPLAAPLSGSWDSRLVKDDAQRVFLDMDPEAFKTIHKAILDAETIRSAGKAASVDHLLDDAAKRDYTGTPDFWVRWMMSTLDKTAAEASSSAVQELQVTATHSGAETVDAVMKGVLAEKARLEEQLRDAQRRRAKIDEEIRAVTPFLLPMSGGDAVRSVEVCGQVISTVQSTLDEMGDIALSHRFDLRVRPSMHTHTKWSSLAVEVVQPDHIGRMVDFYRRKRLGASAACMAAALKMADAREQEAFNINAAMYGVGVKEEDAPTAIIETTPSEEQLIRRRRNDEISFIKEYDTTYAECYYLVDNQGPLPGRITNEVFFDGQDSLRSGLVCSTDYRYRHRHSDVSVYHLYVCSGVNSSIWRFWVTRYGGGPIVKRVRLHIYDPPVPAVPEDSMPPDHLAGYTDLAQVWRLRSKCPTGRDTAAS
ncbi:unnamed protein product [Vitrella brassicaformis CCMP3155]|uniref:Potassium channel tetramerisation-type BTB domain-containing protein n=1 Tax=Vitrella brassicaformis (strain CCMP3155) TaxID=1169540 RepID=A0A0G4G261_VITBC|nr:unnamed protein product [Vitrella brassicaformis CCMP3155]|eukprot:CEM21836.1 unnamed protein product [Vitrella brassicaformis CCMP3155]